MRSWLAVVSAIAVSAGCGGKSDRMQHPSVEASAPADMSRTESASRRSETRARIAVNRDCLEFADGLYVGKSVKVVVDELELEQMPVPYLPDLPTSSGPRSGTLYCTGGRFPGQVVRISWALGRKGRVVQSVSLTGVPDPVHQTR